MAEVKSSTNPQHDKENVKTTRKAFQLLQKPAGNAENMIRKPEKDAEIDVDIHKKKLKVEDKSCQTEESTASVVTADDLTGDNPSSEYWKVLAEQRGEQLNDSLEENHRLQELVESLQEENEICKEMMVESQNVAELLQEALREDSESGDAEENAEEAPSSSNNL